MIKDKTKKQNKKLTIGTGLPGPGRGKVKKVAGFDDNNYYKELDEALIKHQRSKKESTSLKAIQLRLKVKEMQENFKSNQVASVHREITPLIQKLLANQQPDDSDFLEKED